MVKRRSANFVSVFQTLSGGQTLIVKFSIIRFTELGTISTQHCHRREIGMHVVRESQLKCVERCNDGSIASGRTFTSTYAWEISADDNSNGNNGFTIRQRAVASD